MFLEDYLSDVNAAASALPIPNALQRFTQFVFDHAEAIFDDDLICSQFSESDITCLRRSGFLLPYMVSSESQYRLYHPKVSTILFFLFPCLLLQFGTFLSFVDSYRGSLTKAIRNTKFKEITFSNLHLKISGLIAKARVSELIRSQMRACDVKYMLQDVIGAGIVECSVSARDEVYKISKS